MNILTTLVNSSVDTYELTNMMNAQSAKVVENTRIGPRVDCETVKTCIVSACSESRAEAICRYTRRLCNSVLLLDAFLSLKTLRGSQWSAENNTFKRSPLSFLFEDTMRFPFLMGCGRFLLCTCLRIFQPRMVHATFQMLSWRRCRILQSFSYAGICGKYNSLNGHHLQFNEYGIAITESYKSAQTKRSKKQTSEFLQTLCVESGTSSYVYETNRMWCPTFHSWYQYQSH